jgi:AcrR family transcriptional regulator
VAAIRREQIVEAAAGIIATQGIQNLSLSEIEAHTGMSRGQLTYYFKTKEDILLAVFDRMVRRMRERFASADGPCRGAVDPDVWLLMQGILGMVLGQPPRSEFSPLQYTFLAQIGHRDDFRQRLATLYEEWRSHMADDLSRQAPAPAADPRLLASLFQAIVHGLAMQLQADPVAFDRTRMLELCVAVLGRVVNRRPANDRPKPRKAAAPPTNPSGEG